MMMGLARRALAVALCAACGPVVPRPEPPGVRQARHAAAKEAAVASAEAAASSATPAASDPPEPEGARPFHLAWQTRARPFTIGIALEHGKLAVRTSSRVTLYDLRTGAPLPDTAAAAAMSVAAASGSVKVFDADAKLVREVPLGSEVPSALALSADGTRLALGLSDRVVTYAVVDASAAPVAFRVSGGPVSALALSSDGAQLFASTAAPPAIYRVDGTPLQRFHVVRHAIAAGWLGDHEVAVIAERGLFALDATTGSAQSIPWNAPAPTMLAVDAAKSIVCGAAREGTVACFSRGALPAGQTPFIAVGEAGGATPWRTAGYVHAVAKSRIEVEPLAGEPLPTTGDMVRVFRYHEPPKTVGSAARPEWREAGRGKATLANGIVTIELAPLLPSPKTPGRELVPPDLGAFTAGTPVQLVGAEDP
jgi:hypothetical protein